MCNTSDKSSISFSFIAVMHQLYNNTIIYTQIERQWKCLKFHIYNKFFERERVFLVHISSFAVLSEIKKKKDSFHIFLTIMSLVYTIAPSLLRYVIEWFLCLVLRWLMQGDVCTRRVIRKLAIWTTIAETISVSVSLLHHYVQCIILIYVHTHTSFSILHSIYISEIELWHT